MAHEHVSTHGTQAHEHVSTQDTQAREYVRMQGTLTGEHISTEGTQAREHISTQGTLARKHVNKESTLAREHVFSTQGTQFSRLKFLAKQINLITKECASAICERANIIADFKIFETAVHNVSLKKH